MRDMQRFFVVAKSLDDVSTVGSIMMLWSEFCDLIGDRARRACCLCSLCWNCEWAEGTSTARMGVAWEMSAWQREGAIAHRGAWRVLLLLLVVVAVVAAILEADEVEDEGDVADVEAEAVPEVVGELMRVKSLDDATWLRTALYNVKEA